MLKNNAYRKNDKYLYFLFDGIHSSKYNLFITNNNNLQLVNNGKSTTSYVSPSYQDYTHYVGTTTGQKEFKYNVAAEGISLPEYKDMMKWLYNGHKGFLMLDYNNPWGYEVVLETVGDSTFQDTNRGLVVEFSLSFKTIGYHYAKQEFGSQYSTTEILEDTTSADSSDPQPTDNSGTTPTDDSGPKTTDKNSVEQTIQNPWGIPEVVPFVYYTIKMTTGDYLKFDCRTAKNTSFEFDKTEWEWSVEDGTIGTLTQTDDDTIDFTGSECILKLQTEGIENEDLTIRAAAEIKISFKAKNSDSYELLTWENQTVNFYLPSINNCFSHFKYTTSGKHETFSVKVNKEDDYKCNYTFNELSEPGEWTLTYDQQWRYCIYGDATVVEGIDQTGSINLYASDNRLVETSQELEDFVLQNDAPVLMPASQATASGNDVIITFSKETIKSLFDLEGNTPIWGNQQYLSISYKDTSNFSNFCSPYPIEEGDTYYDYKFFNVYYIADENLMPIEFDEDDEVYQLIIPKSQFLIQTETIDWTTLPIGWTQPIIYLGNYNTIEIKNDQYTTDTTDNSITVQVDHYNNL